MVITGPVNNDFERKNTYALIGGTGKGPWTEGAGMGGPLAVDGWSVTSSTRAG